VRSWRKRNSKGGGRKQDRKNDGKGDGRKDGKRESRGDPCDENLLSKCRRFNTTNHKAEPSIYHHPNILITFSYLLLFQCILSPSLALSTSLLWASFINSSFLFLRTKGSVRDV